MVLFHLLFLLCTTIRPKISVLIDLFVLFAHDHSTKIYSPLSFILSFCTTIRPRIRALINLFFLFVHDHSTNVRSYSYSVIYYFLNCASILFAMFMAVLPLYFVYYVHWSAALIFHTLYSWLYIHYWRATLIFLALYSCLYEVSSRSFGCWKSPLSLDIDSY